IRYLTLFILLFSYTALYAKEGSFQRFLVINYHDIVDNSLNLKTLNPPDQQAVSQKNFAAHLAWLKANHYHVISVQDLVDSAVGLKNLPDNAVMLTFDDGYQSFYTRVFPLLKKYRYPATLALVGSWMDGQHVEDRPNIPLMTWPQVREVVASGLVEIASHSYDLHHGIVANPQGNEQSAVTSRLYDKEYDEYEKDEAYRQRIFGHMGKSADFIFQNLGIRPRVMVWPYGEYNAIAQDAAKMAGLTITMGLQDGHNTLADLSAIKRLIIDGNPDAKQFSQVITKQRLSRALRVVHLDMDYIFDTDEKQTDRNLDAVVERILDSRANTVFLQAYSDPDGDGNADELYFPNRHLPVRRDLFNRVAWQLKTRAKVNVYAWMPIMAYKADVPLKWYVKEWREGKPQLSRHIYTRLSPFNPEARQYISEIYEDLAKYCSFDGLLFHDDGILSDYEDVSELAMEFSHQVWNLPEDFEKIHQSSDLRLKWAQHKTSLLAEFTDELADRVRYYRPDIKTARNFYSMPLLKPYSEEWYAQSFKVFLQHYDYVAIEAMPFMEKAENPDQWLRELVRKTAQYPGGLKKMVFELQSVDWAKQQKIPTKTFIDQLELLKKQGAIHIGYYPDDVFQNQPDIDALQKHFPVVVTDN
ncbi:MAG: poly-beta-1,6-N-acetyl-D-glucosamine N-deacetylase PgaB, partial [Methylococcaceae bacterium]